MVSLVETHGIGRRDDGSITSTDPEGVLADDAVASMNCWVFPNNLFAHLEAGFETFLAEHGDEEKTEFLLPTVVNELKAAGVYRVEVVRTAEPWSGHQPRRSRNRPTQDSRRSQLSGLRLRRLTGLTPGPRLGRHRSSG